MRMKRLVGVLLGVILVGLCLFGCRDGVVRPDTGLDVPPPP